VERGAGREEAASSCGVVDGISAHDWLHWIKRVAERRLPVEAGAHESMWSSRARRVWSGRWQRFFEEIATFKPLR